MSIREGNGIKVASGNESLRFLLISGKPLNEPVSWSGPIVMNTEEEIKLALREYHNETFVKK